VVEHPKCNLSSGEVKYFSPENGTPPEQVTSIIFYSDLTSVELEQKTLGMEYLTEYPLPVPKD
jgi:hypothetical protein